MLSEKELCKTAAKRWKEKWSWSKGFWKGPNFFCGGVRVSGEEIYKRLRNLKKPTITAVRTVLREHYSSHCKPYMVFSETRI